MRRTVNDNQRIKKPVAGPLERFPLFFAKWLGSGFFCLDIENE